MKRNVARVGTPLPPADAVTFYPFKSLCTALDAVASTASPVINLRDSSFMSTPSPIALCSRRAPEDTGTEAAVRRGYSSGGRGGCRSMRLSIKVSIARKSPVIG